jgi:hypothetical protein
LKTYPQKLPHSQTIATTAARGCAVGAWTRQTPAVRAVGVASRAEQLFPILFFEAYLLASVLVFAFGPVEFSVDNPWKLYSFVLVGQLVIGAGYALGMAGPPRDYCGRLSANEILSVAIVVTIVLTPLTLHYRNYAGISLTEALRDPRAAYMARLESFDGNADTPLLSITRGLLAPVSGLFVPLGILYWRRMDGIRRALWAAGLAGLVAETIYSGAAVHLFDLVLTIPWLLWLRSHHGLAPQEAAQRRQFAVPPAPRKPARSSQRVALLVVSAAILVAGFQYFSYSRRARYNLADNEYPPLTTGWSAERFGVTLPEPVEYPMYMIARYWTHGYDGLAQCLDLPFEWSYGCGHSLFWSRYVGALCGDREVFLERPYPARLEAVSGYRIANYWHTVYPWLASDVTFPGAIVFMGVMAFLLARAWSDALVGANPFAAGFLVQMLMLFFYIPANNGRLSFPEETLTFWGLMVLWLTTRKR